MAAGATCVGFAKLCDVAMAVHARLVAGRRGSGPCCCRSASPLAAWLTRRFAPEAAGSGIPQVIAAAEQRWHGRWGGQRVTLRTAAWKVVLTAALLLCGGSIGREGPTRAGGRRHHAHPHPRAEGRPGAARDHHRRRRGGRLGGLQHAHRRHRLRAWRSWPRRSSGAPTPPSSWSWSSPASPPTRSQGDYAYFGVLNGEASAGLGLDRRADHRHRGRIWRAACLARAGRRHRAGRQSRRALASRAAGRLRRLAAGWSPPPWRSCSGGLTFGAGYAEAKSLLQDHPGAGSASRSQVRRQPGRLGFRRAGRDLRPLAGDGGGDRRRLRRIRAALRRPRRGGAGDDQLSLRRGAGAADQRGDPDGDDPRPRPCRPAAAGRAAGALGLAAGSCREPIYHVLSANWRTRPER